MSSIYPEIEITGDGSQTLRHPLWGDTYHSLNGAVAEAMHVFIDHGLRFAAEKNAGGIVRIFEAGFGSGLNALLTAREAEKLGVKVEYHSIELYPVDRAVLHGLAYATDPLFMAIHNAPWEESTAVSENFSLKKIEGSLTGYIFDTVYDLFYFDAFAYDTQPEMWSAELFTRLFDAAQKGAALVTYSSKGVVKRNLREAGFEVSRLPGAPGKRHMLRAVKI